MSNQITGPPNDYDFGLDFDYAVWSPNTVITLTNVPWNNDYRDVVMFSSTNALNAYIDGNRSSNVNISNSVYAKASEPISLDVPFNVANTYNYVRVYNPAQPIQGRPDTPKYFYYFITDVRYVAPNTTTIVVQLDVFQTYIRQVTFGRCYIERGHIGIANEDNFRNYGRDFLTVPEGLDTGSNYLVVDRYRRPLMNKADKGVINGAYVGSSIIVASTVDLAANPGSISNPQLKTAKFGSALGLPSGAAFYLFKSVNDFRQFMEKYSQYPWITQGIISITVIPDYRRYWTEGHLGARLPFGGYKAPGGTGYHVMSLSSTGDFRNNQNVQNYIPPRYRHLKKLLTFPYLAIRVSSNTGQQVILQPEYWNSRTGRLSEVADLMPPNGRIGLFPMDYNAHQTGGTGVESPAGDGWDRMVTVSGLPTLPIVNNNAALYMANNARSIAFGYENASWAQQRALGSAQISYDQATMGMNAASEQAGISANADINATRLGNEFANSQAWFNAIGGTAGGAASGLVGGPWGAAIGAVGGAASGAMNLLGTGMQIEQNNAQLANRLAASGASQHVSNALAGGIRDSNRSLAEWAARGDYENTIAGLNAKIQDAQLSAPSIIGQQGGETFNYQNQNMEFRVEYIMPDQASIQTVGEFWLRYGYAIHRFSFVPPSLMTMSKFTYWKMKETYIRSAGMPETFKQAIRGLFEKGVTVWANPDDIGVIDPADNVPLPGIVIDGYDPPQPEPEPDPEPPVRKRRKRKMLVFSAVDDNPSTPGPVWALAGTSPGTDANWIETRDTAIANSFLEACGVESPVGLTIGDFNMYKDLYRGPVSVLDTEVIE